MDAAQFLLTEPSPEVTQIHEGDYKDADGLMALRSMRKGKTEKDKQSVFS